MPLYDYRCHRCGKVFEVRQRFADELLTVHEDCGGEVERLISASALQFKGTGWYVTDYARKGQAASDSNGKSESKAETKGESKGETRGESKGETRGESKGGSKTESKAEPKSESKPAPTAPSPDK